MKTLTKKTLAVFLAAILFVTAAVPSFANVAWDEWWSSSDAEAGIIMFPGSDESERNFSWYSDTESTPYVVIYDYSEGANGETFTGSSVKTYSGTYSNKVTVTGLEEGTTYFYECVSGDYKSAKYSFTTSKGSDFSAVYVTDVHISYDAEKPDEIKNCSETFNEVLTAARLRSNISLVLSAGDQASLGREDEYIGFSSTIAGKALSFATTAGNHDRKGVDYKTFKNLPNERKNNYVSSYITSDYYFVKGDVLFLVMDSNNGSGMDHHAFIKKAVKENPDVKWKVMMCHHDLYSGRLPHREDENKLLRMLWGPMADEFGIDLVLLGHSHYYTVTNVLYDGENVTPMTNGGVIDNAAGTVYMVSGSINRPRNDDVNNLGLSDNVGVAQLTDEKIYNIIDFTENSITVKSYTLESGKMFNSFTLTKSSDNGGHPKAKFNPFNGFVRFCGTVYALFNNIGVYSNLTEKQGLDVNFFDIVFGSSRQ